MRPRGVRYTMTQVAIVATSLVATLLAMLCLLGWMFAARPGEWSVPMRLGTERFGVRWNAGVASLLRVATHPLGIAMLDGRRVETSAGSLRFTRLADDALAIECAPCRFRVPGFGDAPVTIDAARITASQHVNTLTGTLEAGVIRGRYRGELVERGLDLHIALDEAPIADYYKLFGDRIPETHAATIAGSVAFTITMGLPEGRADRRFSIHPTVRGFSVSGLGTEVLAGRMPRVECGATSVRRSRGDDHYGPWLQRAVIAAEDQRFYEHPGYDLEELVQAFARNEAAARVERGASTIPQQLARILYTGSERSGTRKLRELLYAVEMERTLGKARILQLYLALAPWGNDTCGANAAAQRYFGVPANRLDGAEAVWMAAMLHAPERDAARWAARGAIDWPRAQWVANGMRGIDGTTRKRVLDDLASMAMTAESDATASQGDDDGRPAPRMLAGAIEATAPAR